MSGALRKEEEVAVMGEFNRSLKDHKLASAQRTLLHRASFQMWRSKQRHQGEGRSDRKDNEEGLMLIPVPYYHYPFAIS